VTNSETSSEQVLTVEKEGSIAWLKLNRPKVMNCLNRDLLKALLAACEELKEDRNIRVVGIIGSGTKSFCAGADLAERKGMTQGDTLDYLALIQRTMRAIETFRKLLLLLLTALLGVAVSN
jgi:enoyl-CoA hydratase